MRINSPFITGSSTITGDLCVHGTVFGTITGIASTASYALNAETLDGLDSTQLVLTSSFNSYTSSISSSIGDLSGSISTTTSGLAGRITTVEGNYVTTGSNTLIGDQNITGSICSTGDIVTTGQIVAQTINVQQVTSSIVYSCGSNTFGCSLTNNQVFTGSVFITGSNIIACVDTSCFGGSIAISGGNDLIFRDASNYISSPATDTLRIVTANTQRILITSTGISCFACQICAPAVMVSGCVGIGTSAPTFGKLEVRSSDSTLYCANADLGNGVNIFNETTTNGTFSSLRLGVQGSERAGITYISAVHAGDASADISFTTRSGGTFGEKMRITNGGCVGVGTSTPRTTLHIQQATNDGTPNVGCARDGLIVSSNNGNYGLNIGVDPTGPSWLQSGRFDDGATGYNLLLQPTNRCSVLIGTGSGIGGCRQQLVIGGNGFGSLIALGNNGNGDKFVIESDSSENVLINNKSATPMIFYTSGSRRFDITSTGIACFACQICANSLTVATDCSGVVVDVANRHGFMKYVNYSSGLVGACSGTDSNIATWLGRFAGTIFAPTAVYQDLVVDGSGNVGVGTITPSAKLNVGHNAHGLGFSYLGASALPSIAGLFTSNGTAGGYGFGDLLIKSRSDYGVYNMIFYTACTNNTPLERMRITPGGNVGIGTCTPASKLSVHGQFRVNTSSADGNENRLYFNPGGAADPAQLYLYNEAQTNTIYITANGTSEFNAGIVCFGSTICANGTIFSATNYRVSTGTSAGNSSDPAITTGGCTKTGIYFAGSCVGLGSGGNGVLLNAGGTLFPAANGTQDLGTSSLRWCTVYTSDLS